MTPEMQAEHNQLALRLAMCCTLAMARTGQMPEDLAKICADELRRVAQLTDQDDQHMQLAARMNSIAARLEGR